MVAILTSIKTVANGQPVTRKDFGRAMELSKPALQPTFRRPEAFPYLKNDPEMGLVGQGARAGCGSPF